MEENEVSVSEENGINKENSKKTLMNTIMLYVYTIAKLIFPLCTLPYLTRVLSLEVYGTVSYLKSVGSYVQLIIDFGFLLSAVADIVKCGNDMKRIGYISGHVLLGKILLGIVTFFAGIGLTYAIPIMREQALFSILSILAVSMTCFFADFLFRGIEKMHVISIIFIISKGISTFLTFFVIKSDADILLIPTLDIIGNFIAIILTFIFIHKYKIKLVINNFKFTLKLLRNSFVFFASSIATTAFGAFNTLMIGIFIEDLTLIAYWSLSLQIITAIENLYTPILNGIYPQMIKEKKLKILNIILLIIMPIILLGTTGCYFLSDFILEIIGGQDYINASPIFVRLLPLLIISFPSMLFGWPALGCINKNKEVTLTTIVTAVLQVSGLLILILCGQFTIYNIIIVRIITESFMLLYRLFYVIKFRDCYCKIKKA